MDNSEKLSFWRNKIDAIKSKFDNNKNEVSDYIKFYHTNYNDALKIGNNVPIIAVNEVYAYVETSLSRLYYTDPYITVNPKNRNAFASAKIQEELINYYWCDHLKMKRQIRKCIRECELVGRSWIKVGYEANIEKKVDNSGNENEYISTDDIYAVHINFDDIYYDLDAYDPPYDCKWICHKYKRNSQDILDRYGITVEGESLSGDKLNKEKYVLVYEIWDKISGNVYIYCDGYDDFLDIKFPVDKDCIGPYKLKGFPFVMLTYNDLIKYNECNDEMLFPISPINPQRPQIEEKIKLRSMELNHIKRHNRQLFVKKGTLDQGNKEKFKKGIDGAVIDIDGDLGNSIMPSPYPPLQSDIYAVETRIDMDRDKISGQSSLDQGGTIPTKTRTVGELEMVSANTASRSAIKLDMVEDFCEEIATKMIRLMQQFFDVPRYLKLSNKANKTFFQELAQRGMIGFDDFSIRYTKESIQGDTDINVVIGSTIPMTKENRLKTLLSILKFGPAINLTPDSIAGKELGKLIMRDLGVIEMESAYNMDLINQNMEAKEPTPQEQMALAKQIQNIKKTQLDMELKQERINSAQLGNLDKAVKNSENINNIAKTRAMEEIEQGELL